MSEPGVENLYIWNSTELALMLEYNYPEQKEIVLDDVVYKRRPTQWQLQITKEAYMVKTDVDGNETVVNLEDCRKLTNYIRNMDDNPELQKPTHVYKSLKVKGK